MGYNFLKEYSEKVRKVADECVRLMLEDKNDYPCMIIVEDVLQQFGLKTIDAYLLEEMLAERDEVKDVSVETSKNCSRVFLTRSGGYLGAEVEENYMEMKVPGGKIVVERGGDKEYQDMYIYYVDDKNKENGFDIAAISANDKEKIGMYLYEDKDSDAPTKESIWRR